VGPRVLELLAAGDKEAAQAECMVLLDLKARILELMKSLQAAVARHNTRPAPEHQPTQRPDAY